MLEASDSGLFHHLGKVAGSKGSREFKSHRLRKFLLQNAISISGGVCWTKFECILLKIPKNKSEWTRQGETICLGEWIRPVSTDFPPAGGVWGGMRASFPNGLNFLLPNIIWNYNTT